MNKLFDRLTTILTILVALVCVYLIYNQRITAKNLKNYAKAVSEIQEYASILNNLNGATFSITPVFNEKGKLVDKIYISTDYYLVLVVGKVNCNLCIKEIIQLIETLKMNRLTVIGILYDSDTEYKNEFIYTHTWSYPLYSGNLENWYKINKLDVGPSLLLVDGKTNKVVSSFVNVSMNIINSQQMYFDYLIKMFGTTDS